MEINVCPQWLLLKLRVPARAQAHVGLLLSSALALTVSPLLVRIPHFCVMQKVLGIPCPGCGIMHSLIAMLHLDFAAAWRFNPAGIVLALYFVLQICGRVMALASMLSAKVMTRASRFGEGVVAAMLLGVWSVRLLNV